MSKESYVRGFCKAAEAAGVDPVALAKYAQQYKTDGYAPRWQEWSKMPFINFTPKNTWDISTRFMPDPNKDPQERLKRVLTPQREAWFNANSNALSKINALMSKAKFPSELDFDTDTVSMLSKIYHDEMKRTTSAPPAKVTSPLKKSK